MANYSIDSFSVQYARDLNSGLEKRHSATYGPIGNNIDDPNPFIDLIRDTLVAAGWTLVQNIPAHGTWFLPGWGGGGGLKYKDRSGVLSQGWDNGIGPCGSFDFPGSTPIGQDDLIGALNTCQASPPQWHFTKTFISVTPLLGGFFAVIAKATTQFDGTRGNDMIVFAESLDSPYYPGVRQFGNTYGGGYTLASQAANNVTQIVMNVTENSWGHVQFDIGTASYLLTGNWHNLNPQLGNRPTYRIIANPYQFCIYDKANPATDSVGNGGWIGGNSIFVCAPFVDQARMPGMGQTFVIVGPGQFMTNTVWGSFPITSQINGGQVFTHGPGGDPGETLGLERMGVVSCIFPFQQPLLTSNLKTLALNAYLVAAMNQHTESTIVGKIWDSCVLTGPQAVGSQFGMDGHNFEVVSSQSAAVESSIILAI